MSKRLLAAALLVLAAVFPATAEEPIFEKQFAADFEATYEKVHAALEDARFWVVSEVKISDNLARFAERWGEDYNRSDLDAIRGLIVCNPWYTNQIANHDPRMLALCPLSVTIVTRDDTSRVFFTRPTALAAGSPALEVLAEAEAAIIAALEAITLP